MNGSLPWQQHRNFNMIYLPKTLSFHIFTFIYITVNSFITLIDVNWYIFPHFFVCVLQTNNNECLLSWFVNENMHLLIYTANFIECLMLIDSQQNEHDKIGGFLSLVRFFCVCDQNSIENYVFSTNVISEKKSAIMLK